MEQDWTKDAMVMKTMVRNLFTGFVMNQHIVAARN